MCANCKLYVMVENFYYSSQYTELDGDQRKQLNDIMDLVTQIACKDDCENQDKWTIPQGRKND